MNISEILKVMKSLKWRKKLNGKKSEEEGEELPFINPAAPEGAAGKKNALWFDGTIKLG